jgi:outer membrane protein assembly factor BamE (lipoprotein component of BamABCDE complex)
MSTFIRFFSCCLLIAALSACVNKPVRHLASDASLISPGTSTKSDVLTYLGDPDERQTDATAVERWYYYDQEQSALQRTFYVGKWFGPKSYNRIVVTFDGELGTDISYNASETEDFKPTAEQDQEKRQ